jgi:hypothetical protein
MTNLTTRVRYDRHVYAWLGASGRTPLNTIPY